MRFGWADSPVGRLRLAADAGGLREIRFPGPGEGSSPAEDREPGTQTPGAVPSVAGETAIAAAQSQLREYFAGSRREFDLPLAPSGTDFQLRVWEATRAIAYGETLSYGEIARGLGDPGASRAVGIALHVNPLPIVVPCHRVIGADGALVGFGGGLDRKRFLLRLEGSLRQDVLF